MNDIELVNQLVAEAKKWVGDFKLSKDFITAGAVAAALITKTGNIYTGICLDMACGIGFCAEHSAIAEMLKHHESEINMIVAITENQILPPCGRCRELMMQINSKNSKTKIGLPKNKIKLLEELLPNSCMDLL